MISEGLRVVFLFFVIFLFFFLILIRIRILILVQFIVARHVIDTGNDFHVGSTETDAATFYVDVQQFVRGACCGSRTSRSIVKCVTINIIASHRFVCSRGALEIEVLHPLFILLRICFLLWFGAVFVKMLIT